MKAFLLVLLAISTFAPTRDAYVLRLHFSELTDSNTQPVEEIPEPARITKRLACCKWKICPEAICEKKKRWAERRKERQQIALHDH